MASTTANSSSVKKETKWKPPARNFSNKESSRTPGVEETLRKAAEEEAERQRLAAAAAEEAKLAAQREEEMKLKQQSAMALLNDEERRKDLTAWIRSVPLSRGCIKRIDRAFSDGSLVAEIIHHFCPSICDKRQYFRWNSRSNKMSNWEALNHKVFPKLGFHLNQKQINNILNPFQCGKFEKDCEKGMFIYKLLGRIRNELAHINPSVMDYRKSNFVPPVCKTKSFQRKFTNFLDNPPFSKVEWLVEQGHYDKDKEDKSSKKSKCKDSVCPSKSEGCLNAFPMFGCITFDENGCECGEIVLQPTFSCVWPPANSCFLC